MWFHAHFYFKSPYYSDTVSCVTYSQTDILNAPGVLCHWSPKQVDDGPLWDHTMPDTRVIFGIFLLVKFIIFLGISNFVFITPNSDFFLISGHPATDVGKFWRGCLLKSDMRSGDIARTCSGRLSIGNLQGRTPCVLDWVSSRARQDQLHNSISSQQWWMSPTFSLPTPASNWGSPESNLKQSAEGSESDEILRKCLTQEEKRGSHPIQAGL